MKYKFIITFFVLGFTINCGSSVQNTVQIESFKCECSEEYALISVKEKLIKENVNDLTLFIENRKNLKYEWINNNSLKVKLLAGLDWNYSYTPSVNLLSDTINLALVGRLNGVNNHLDENGGGCTHFLEFNIKVKDKRNYIVSLDKINFDSNKTK